MRYTFPNREEEGPDCTHYDSACRIRVLGPESATSTALVELSDAPGRARRPQREVPDLQDESDAGAAGLRLELSGPFRHRRTAFRQVSYLQARPCSDDRVVNLDLPGPAQDQSGQSRQVPGRNRDGG